MSQEENQNSNGKEPEQTGQKKGGFESFISTALRTRKGIREQLLAQSLIKSNIVNDHLVKIQSLCEAAEFSKQKDKLDMALVEAAQLSVDPSLTRWNIIQKREVISYRSHGLLKELKRTGKNT